jgi:hypothetical protein
MFDVNTLITCANHSFHRLLPSSKIILTAEVRSHGMTLT